MSPTRFPLGVSTAKKIHPLGDFIMPDITAAHVYWEDFSYYRPADWTIATGGTGNSAALTDIDGGGLALVAGSGVDYFINLQKVGESFLFETGKKLWFEARVKIISVTGTGLTFGLFSTTLADHMFFEAADGNVFVQFSKDSSSNAIPLGSLLVDDTFIRLGFLYDGNDTMSFFVDGVMATSTTDLVNLPDDEELTILLVNENFVGGPAKTSIVDYILVAKER